eukprot:3674756-Prymnesium_polylepis.1
MALGRGRRLNRPLVRTSEKRGSVVEAHCVSAAESHSQPTKPKHPTLAYRCFRRELGRDGCVFLLEHLKVNG